jgi:Protein of unknown function (DUF2889)
MPLSSPQPRKPSHTRNWHFEGFEREDGLWDLEGHLQDTKPYDFQVPSDGVRPAHVPIHGLFLRVTVDDAFTVVHIEAAMDHIPHPECSSAPKHMSRLIGAQMGLGWRKAVNEAIGGVQGCTHLREMLFALATVAYQTIPAARVQRLRDAGMPVPMPSKPPRHVDQCMSWAIEGPVVQRHFPMFFKPKSQDLGAEQTPEQG